SVRTPTADLLVGQLNTGSLDAAIVYRANTSKVRNDIDIITINEGLSTAKQPIAIGISSKHKYLVQRLIDALSTPKSQKRFKDADFRWLKKSK
ncbi:MAG: substrate-binding domain-containing protein, partial [Planctomycetes bacterium]|nr:substrate-binding domain-containing protein [Planctomycetota bacterium]